VDNAWVCGSCRSINEARQGRCYRCHAPRDLAAVDPETMPVTGTIPQAGRAPRYRSSSIRAGVARNLILLALVVTVAGGLVARLVADRLLGGSAALGASIDLFTVVAIVQLAAVALALVAWAAWLSRVVGNLPAVGAGYPNVTPRAAFLENFVPFLNFLRVPAILRDVVRRLDPGGRGDALIAAAWLGLVGGILVPRFAGPVVQIASPDVGSAVDASVVVAQVGIGFQVAGGLFLIALMGWIEGRMRARARDIAGRSGEELAHA